MPSGTLRVTVQRFVTGAPEHRPSGLLRGPAGRVTSARHREVIPARRCEGVTAGATAHVVLAGRGPDDRELLPRRGLEDTGDTVVGHVDARWAVTPGRVRTWSVGGSRGWARSGDSVSGSRGPDARSHGRRERFDQLYLEHSHRLLGFALRRVPGADEAADVVADVFVVVWRRLDEVPEGEEALLWMYGVARFVLQNHQRGRRRQDRLSMRMRQEFRAFVDDVVPIDDGPRRESVFAALAALPDDDRELLCLVGWEELDRAQVARVLGCSRAAVRVRLHRARRRFARELAARGVEGTQRRGAAGHEPGGWAVADPDKEEAR